jgi:hypothetical protein
MWINQFKLEPSYEFVCLGNISMQFFHACSRLVLLFLVSFLTVGFGLPKKEDLCKSYATEAIEQNQSGLAFGCGLRGPEWNSDYYYHYHWCMGQKLGPSDVFAKLESSNSTIGWGFRYRRDLLSNCETDRAGGKPAPAAPVAIDTVCRSTSLPSCSGPYFAKGATCRGDYCSAIELTCCRYSRNGGPALTQQEIADADSSHLTDRWQQWFSEEPPNNYSDSQNGFVKGLNCKGDNCDYMSLRIVTTPAATNIGQCYWSRSFSEERPNSGTCDKSEFVAGMRCSGRYCDNIQLHCCRARLN